MKQKILDQYHHLTRGMFQLEFLNSHILQFYNSI